MGIKFNFEAGLLSRLASPTSKGNPFTGVAVWKYAAPNPNGQKWNQITYKDGKQHGLETYWYENGQKKEEWIFKDRKKHGPVTYWYGNGQKSSESTWKDGRRISTTVWKPRGEKCPDTNVVNGTGIICDYHDNGQKEYEATWKDGKFISVQEWDEDGNTK